MSLGRLVYEYHYHHEENIKQYSIKSTPPKIAYRIRTGSSSQEAGDNDVSVMLVTTAAPACLLFNFMVD